MTHASNANGEADSVVFNSSLLANCGAGCSLKRLGMFRPLFSSKGNTFVRNLALNRQSCNYIIKEPRKALSFTFDVR